MKRTHGWCDALKKILRHGDTLASTEDIDEFVFNRQEEAKETAELLADCATGDVTTQTGFYTDFMPVLRTTARAANYIDTLLDHRRDTKEKKLMIKGSKEFCNKSMAALNSFNLLVRSFYVFALYASKIRTRTPYLF